MVIPSFLDAHYFSLSMNFAMFACFYNLIFDYIFDCQFNIRTLLISFLSYGIYDCYKIDNTFYF